MDAIVNDSKDLTDLLTKYTLSDSIWNTYISPDGVVGHGVTSIQDLLIANGTIERIIEFEEKKLLNHKSEYPPICEAALRGRLDVVEYMAKCGNALDTKSGLEETPLDCATTFSHVATALWLIENGANVNCQDNGGRTPLHSVKDVTIARALLDAGADPTLRTKSKDYSMDAIQNQIQERRIEILTLFVEKGLIGQDILEKICPLPSIEEQGRQVILNNTRNAEELRMVSKGKAGRVLPFDYVDIRSGSIEFSR